MNTRNQELFARAQKHIPGGVNSPVRAFRSVGGTPRFFARGAGARVIDVDDNAYLDYVGSWGPLILGHAHPEVVAAVQQAASHGLSFGAPTEMEVEMADLLCELFTLESDFRPERDKQLRGLRLILDNPRIGRLFVLRVEGKVAGMANALITISTAEGGPVLLVEEAIATGQVADFPKA